MIAAASNVGYIKEPFNIRYNISTNPKPFNCWFKYISDDNGNEHIDVFHSILNFNYPLSENTIKVRTPSDLGVIVRDQSLFLLNKLSKNRPLIKDPIAFFSAEWLSKTFGMDTVVMIRHPAAFYSSLKIKQWGFDFKHFRNQPALMEKYLYRFETQIHDQAGKQKEIIDQAILFWNCIHHTIQIYQKNNPNWLFIRHEDLSFDPLSGFKSIYHKLGLEFTPKSERKILKSSGAHNPVEQDERNEYVRNSKENIYNWKHRLSSSEIEHIREQTSEIADEFYTETEW